MTTITLPLRNSINRSPVRAFVLIPLVLACFALSPHVGATCQDACSGTGNTVHGDDALISLTTGEWNTATGALALKSNTTGYENTATGGAALVNNTEGHQNVAIGGLALEKNTTGSLNTAIGLNALENITTGSDNIALGEYAGSALTTQNQNILIGHPGFSDSKTIYLGWRFNQTNTFIAGISGVTVPTGIPVIVDVNGHLGTTTSSSRFKEAIKPMDKASEAILALKPVTFRYKHDLDSDGIPQFGLVAEDVEKVNPDLVARDDQGKPYTVRYEAVNAMLLNEFLKEHRKVEEQQVTITQVKKDFGSMIAHQQKQIEALTAGLQKVSAQLEASKPAPQTVKNP
jgi:trimeric autotransporter adhesin